MAIALIIGIIKFTYKQTYSVSLNGEIIGYTQNKVELQKRINDYINSGDSEDVAFVEIKDMPEYTVCLLKNGIETNNDEIFEKVKSVGTQYYKYYAVTEENEEKAYIKEFSDAEAIINKLKEKNSTNSDKLGIVEKFAKEEPECKTIDVAVSELYKKNIVVAKTDTTNQKQTTNVPKAGYTGPSVKTDIGVSLVKPVSGTISSRFGIRSRDNHKGLDISAPKGTAIKAAAGGTVTFAGYGSNTNGYSGYGNIVVIKSNGSVSILYGHCSALYVSTGQQITQGQVIAAVGSTGISTGNHLHFEIRKNGKPIDPQNYIY